MCLISGKIKLCTCKASSTEKLTNYWVILLSYWVWVRELETLLYCQ